jgi:hypothetical protein
MMRNTWFYAVLEKILSILDIVHYIPINLISYFHMYKNSLNTSFYFQERSELKILHKKKTNCTIMTVLLQLNPAAALKLSICLNVRKNTLRPRGYFLPSICWKQQLKRSSHSSSILQLHSKTWNKRERQRLALSSTPHIKVNDTFNANSHVMMSPFVRMAPLNLAFTLEDNRASLRCRQAGQPQISTCYRGSLNSVHREQHSVLFILFSNSGNQTCSCSPFILMPLPRSRKSCVSHPTFPHTSYTLLCYVSSSFYR